MAYWLMKSEPDVYGIDDLKRDKQEPWDGIRNYQVRNMFRDQMQIGDIAFFYHSNCKIPAITGLMTIVSGAYPDITQFDPESKYFDGKSDPKNPRWLLVDVKYKRKLKREIPLKELKAHEQLQDFRLNQKGNRLSVIPVGKKEWDLILDLE
jgi:predicted RNA-binding protein with PUA-like domain